MDCSTPGFPVHHQLPEPLKSCPMSQWCHPTLSSSVVPFSSCLQSFQALGSFQMTQFFELGGQSTGVSASASVLPMNTQDWFPLGWTGWISLLPKGLPKISWNLNQILLKNFPQFDVIHTVKGFGIVHKAEIDVFLELSCFFDDPADVGNLISGSSAFSKYSLNIWKFTVHVLLKPGNASMWDGMNAIVQWFEHSLALPFFGTGMKTDLFQSCGHCWVFQICWHIECSTFTASSLRTWNSSAGIPSPPSTSFVCSNAS